MLKPTISIDEVPLEEIFSDLRLVAVAYKKIKRWEWPQRLCYAFLSRPFRIQLKEKQLNSLFIKELLPTAKSLSYFKVVHCEPKEIYFCKLEDGKFATHAGSLIRIHKDDFDNDTVPSAISHETVHIFSPVACESVTTLLGCEVDARMALRGHKTHQISLYKVLRYILRHASYLKAKKVGQIEKWKDFMKYLDPNLMTQEYLTELISDFEGDGGSFGKASDYALSPYLSLKVAAKNNIDYAVEEFKLFGLQKREKIEIPALVSIWKELVQSKGGHNADC